MPNPDWSQRGLHVIAKPIGPICNLACSYCFYLEKESLYSRQRAVADVGRDARRPTSGSTSRPSRERVEEIDFAFQGGEPTLLGLDFFRRVVELAAAARPAAACGCTTRFRPTASCWTTPGASSSAEHNFLVGLSIDGPADLHDKYRVDRQGQGTFDR